MTVGTSTSWPAATTTATDPASGPVRADPVRPVSVMVIRYGTDMTPLAAQLTEETDALVRDLREALAAAGDPARAEQQRRYLKSAMEMYGVGVPRTRRIAQAVAASHPCLWRDATGWEAALRRVWDTAGHREERFAVLAIIRSRLSAPHADRIESLVLYEHLLRTGQWWDLVDEASHAVGLVVRAHPAAAARMRAWATDADLWVRRSAIICQLQHKEHTDLPLLSDVIEANQDDGEFFIRKAIGWALRDYARTDGAWVRAFVTDHPRLSPLSRREALKHL